MRHLKKRFCIVTAILAVLACTLTGTSYAWLVITTNPEVTNIVASVGANQNLEIALDDGYLTQTDVDLASVSADGASQGSTAGDPYTWGNLVDLSKAFESSVPMLRPVRFVISSTNSIEYPRYDLDGRLHSLGTLQPTTVSDYSGKGTKGGVKFYSPDGKPEDGYAYSVTYWMRSNLSGDVTLSEAAKRANDGTGATTGVNGVMGEGSYISIPLAGNGTAAEMDRFVSKLRVVFMDETRAPSSVIFEASIGAGQSDGVERKYNLVTRPTNAGDQPIYVSTRAAQPISLNANEGRKVTMYVYLDGEDITNKEALLYDTDGVKINIQFDHSAIRDETSEGGAMTGDTAPDSAYGGGVSN